MVVLEGFHGWLALLATSQFLSLALVLAADMALIPQYVELWRISTIRSAMAAEITLFVVLLALMLYTTLMMVKKRRIFPTLYRAQLVMLAVVPILTLLIVSSLSGISLAELEIRTVAGEVGVGAVFSMGWILYTLRSVRVRNTFVR